MTEIDGKENRDAEWGAAQLGRCEPQILGAFHRGRVEAGVSARLLDPRRVRRHLPLPVDVQPQGDVPLHLARVECGRVVERQLCVQHPRRLVRSVAPGLEHLRHLLRRVLVRASHEHHRREKSQRCAAAHELRHARNVASGVPLPFAPVLEHQIRHFERARRARPAIVAQRAA